jgi:hypothetical protein
MGPDQFFMRLPPEQRPVYLAQPAWQHQPAKLFVANQSSEALNERGLRLGR